MSGPGDSVVVACGAVRACRACSVRFATALCPRCGAAPTFTSYDRTCHEWIKQRRREYLRALRARPSERATAGGISAAMASIGAALWIASPPHVGIVTLAAWGAALVFGAAAATRTGERSLGQLLVVLPLLRDTAGPASFSVRGKLISRGKQRHKRWAVEGTVEGVEVADFFGSQLILQTPGGTEIEIETEGATLVVEGHTVFRTRKQLGLGKPMADSGFLRGRAPDPMRAIPLHDGMLVEVHGECSEIASPLGEGRGFRTAPTITVLKPSNGCLWISLLS